MIEILVLQNPKVLVNKQEMMFPYKKVEALLYYMAVEKSATRDQIATLLWEDCDESSARKNVRHALYTIRKVFGEELITSPTRQNLELNQELEIESDYDRFLEENEKDRTEVYKADFLQNFYLKNAGAFENWMNFKRIIIKCGLKEIQSVIWQIRWYMCCSQQGIMQRLRGEHCRFLWP